MRITAGSGKGRKLKVPSGLRVRPTSDKVKQALFNILGEKVRGCAFLDLFAGAGSVGIEAISRGAGKVLFVDDSRESVLVINKNIEQARFGERAQVLASGAEPFLKKASEQFDVVFLDPPYAIEQEPLLKLVSGSRILKPGSVVVYEHFKKRKPPQQAGRLCLYREAAYGDTVLAFYKLHSA